MIFWVSAGTSKSTLLKIFRTSTNYETATLGPALGPVVAGFSVQAEIGGGPEWEMLWLFAPIFMSCSFSS